jgi:hypothetical protein
MMVASMVWALTSPRFLDLSPLNQMETQNGHLAVMELSSSTFLWGVVGKGFFLGWGDGDSFACL